MEPTANELISVIVPVYNRRDSLAACVESILAQSYQPLEIILVNDGSSDGSGDICDAYARKNERIRVVHQENRGVSAARNTGICMAMGGFLGFVDADDQIKPQMYAFLHQLLHEFHTDIAACARVQIMEDGSGHCTQKPTETVALSPREAFLAMNKGSYFGSDLYTKIYRRALFQEDAPPLREDIAIGEDLLLNGQLFVGGASIAYQPLPLYQYYVHQANTMGTFNTSRRDEFTARMEIIRLAEAFGPDVEKEAKAAYCQTAIFYRMNARKAGAKEDERLAWKEILRYLGPMLSSRMFGVKSKIRMVLFWLFPGFSGRLWNFLSTRLGMKWTATEK